MREFDDLDGEIAAIDGDVVTNGQVTWGMYYEDVTGRRRHLRQHDPVCIGISLLMAGNPNTSHTWRGTPEKLYQAIKPLAMRHEARFDGKFPANAKVMWEQLEDRLDALLPWILLMFMSADGPTFGLWGRPADTAEFTIERLSTDALVRHHRLNAILAQDKRLGRR